MGRFLLTVVLGLALFAGLVWYFDLLPSGPEFSNTGPKADSTAAKLAELGNVLYPAKAMPLPLPARSDLGIDPIVISGHLQVMDKVDIPSPVEGQLLFVGEEVPEEALALAGVAPFCGEPYLYARINQGRQDLMVVYRRIQKGQTVYKGQMVALVDPSKALNEVKKSRAKVKAAEADYLAAEYTLKEAQARLDAAEILYNRVPRAIGAEDYRERKLAKDKYASEKLSKAEAINLAKAEEGTAQVMLKQHYLRIPPQYERSVVETIYRHSGEAVKTMEPVMQIYGTSRLLAEGMVEVQFKDRMFRGLSALTVGQPAIVEPTIEEAPFKVLKGHRGEVTAVTISKKQQILSASEDKTVRMWNPLRVLRHPEPVKSLACSPPACKGNWCLTGLANGHIYLWDLDRPQGPELVKIFKDVHHDAVTCLAFSPDGTWFASGGADNLICLWKTDEGLLYPFDEEHGVDRAPQGTITSLTFTPQTKLVSASRDNTLRVWELYEKRARLLDEPIGGRGGNVTKLGVSQDGRWMLFDQGKTLQLVSITTGQTGSVLQNPVASASFDTLALFSPDASLILTAGAPEGRMQLWRSPDQGGRGFEVRQLVTEEKGPVACAAFAPDPGLSGQSSFAVSGTKDGNVYLWIIPGKYQVDRHRIRNLKLSMVGQAVDAGTRMLRVGVELRNQDGRLIDGRPVTIVIEP